MNICEAFDSLPFPVGVFNPMSKEEFDKCKWFIPWRGPPGPQGPPGPPGPQGEKGEKGEPGSGSGVQPDWEVKDETSLAYIKNKPQINHTVIIGNRDLPEIPIGNEDILALFNKNIRRVRALLK